MLLSCLAPFASAATLHLIAPQRGATLGGGSFTSIEWTKRFVQVAAPGRLGGESECEIRPIFEFENFGPSEAVERFREMGASRLSVP